MKPHDTPKSVRPSPHSQRSQHLQTDCKLAALLGELAPLVSQLATAAVESTKNGPNPEVFQVRATNVKRKLHSLASDCRLLSITVACLSDANDFSDDDLVV